MRAPFLRGLQAFALRLGERTMADVVEERRARLDQVDKAIAEIRTKEAE
jgi:hypothetical protein